MLFVIEQHGGTGESGKRSASSLRVVHGFLPVPLFFLLVFRGILRGRLGRKRHIRIGMVGRLYYSPPYYLRITDGLVEPGDGHDDGGQGKYLWGGLGLASPYSLRHVP
jgi:hypothetical protein